LRKLPPSRDKPANKGVTRWDGTGWAEETDLGAPNDDASAAGAVRWRPRLKARGDRLRHHGRWDSAVQVAVGGGSDRLAVSGVRPAGRARIPPGGRGLVDHAALEVFRSRQGVPLTSQSMPWIPGDRSVIACLYDMVSRGVPPAWRTEPWRLLRPGRRDSRHRSATSRWQAGLDASRQAAWPHAYRGVRSPGSPVWARSPMGKWADSSWRNASVSPSRATAANRSCSTTS